MDNETHLTPEEVAARWRVHKATVLRLFHQGILPGLILRQGRARTTVRFRLDSIMAWEKKREREALEK